MIKMNERFCTMLTIPIDILTIFNLEPYILELYGNWTISQRICVVSFLVNCIL